MDVARTAKRLGVEEPMIVYRRSRKEMPAHDFEASEAEEEGVMIHWLRTIKQIDETTFTVEKMTIDETGRPQAALSISGPKARIDDQRLPVVGAQVKAMADRISAEMGGHAPI